MENDEAKPPSSETRYRVLVVDDDDVVREGLVGYLENYHEAPYSLTIDSAANPAVGRERLERQPYDLVVSDINMPEEDGFHFLKFVKQQYPQTKTALITAYKVEDYIRNARKTGTYNVIAKTAPFNFEELSSVVNNLLIPEKAFGLVNYLAPACRLETRTVTSSDDIMAAFGELKTFLDATPVRNVPDLLTAVIEAVTNAVYHVAKKPDGTLKYDKGQQIERLAPEEYVQVQFGVDTEKVGIAIVDQGGRITADEIVYWLERNLSGQNLMDTHGRGVYLIHALADRLLVNIAPGNKTEIIMMSYFAKDFSANKPVYINQLG